MCTCISRKEKQQSVPGLPQPSHAVASNNSASASSCSSTRHEVNCEVIDITANADTPSPPPNRPYADDPTQMQYNPTNTADHEIMDETMEQQIRKYRLYHQSQLQLYHHFDPLANPYGPVGPFYYPAMHPEQQQQLYEHPYNQLHLQQPVGQQDQLAAQQQQQLQLHQQHHRCDLQQQQVLAQERHEREQESVKLQQQRQQHDMQQNQQQLPAHPPELQHRQRDLQQQQQLSSQPLQHMLWQQHLRHQLQQQQHIAPRQQQLQHSEHLLRQQYLPTPQLLERQQDQVAPRRQLQEQQQQQQKQQQQKQQLPPHSQSLQQQGSPLRQQHLPAQQHLMREQDRLDSPHQLEPEPNHASHQHVQHGPVARFICLGSNQTTGDTLTRLRTMMLGQTGASGTWTVHENSSQYMDPDAARQVGQQLVGPTYTYTGSALFPRSATATPQHYPTPTTTTDNVYEAGEQQMLQGLRPSYSGTILDLSTRANARAHALTAERMPQQQSEMLPRLPSGWSEQMQPIGVPQHSYPIRGTIEWTRRAQGLSLSSSSPALGPAVSSTAFNVPIQHAATVGRTNQQNELYQQAVQRSASHLSDFWAEAMVNRTSDQPHRSWDYARIMAPIQTHRGQIEEGRMPTATVTRAGIVPSGVVADSYRTSVPSVWEAEGRISSSLSNVPAALVTLPTPTVQSAPVPSNHSIESVPINDYTSSSASSLEHEAPADKPQSSVGSANARIQQMFTIPLSTNNMTVTVSLLSPNMAPLPPSRDPPRPTPAEFALPTPLQQGAQQDAGPFPTALSERRLQPRNDHQTVSYPEPSASGISSYRQAMVAPPSAGVSEHHQAPSPMTLEKTIVTSSTPREEVREQAVAVQQPHVQLSKPEVPPLPTRALLPNQGDTLWTPEQHAQLDREVVTVCTKRELPAAPPSTPVVQEGAQPVASLPTAPRTLDLEGDVVGVELPQQVLPSASTEPTTASHASSGSSFCCGARNHSIASIIGPSRSHSIASAPLPAERPVQPNRTIKLTQSATHIMFTTPQQHQNSEHTAATLWDSSYHYTDQASQTLNTEPTKQSVGDTSHLYQFPYPYNAEYLEDTDSDDESPSYDATTRPPYNIDEARAQEVQMQDENGDDEEEDYDEYDEEEDEEEEKVKEEYDEAVEVQVKEEVVGCVKRPMDDTKHDVTASSAEFGDCKPSTSGAREWKLQRQNSNLKMHFYRDSNVYKIKSEAGGEVLTEDEEEEEEEDDNSEDVRAQEQQREHTLCPGQPIALEPAGTHDSHHQYPMYDARKDLDLSSQSSNASSRSSSSSSNETTATVPADDCRLVGQERGYESPEEQCTPNDIEVETKKRRTE